MKSAHVRNIPRRRWIRVTVVAFVLGIAAASFPALAGPAVQVTSKAGDAGGPLVSVDAVDADVTVVLRALADVGKLNVVFSDGAEGRVTVVLRDVPLGDAMESVAWAAGLGITVSGSVRSVRPGSAPAP